MTLSKKQAGQSMAEIIIAIAIFAIVSAAALLLALSSHRSISQSQNLDEVNTIVREGIEAVKSIAEADWNSLDCRYGQNGFNKTGLDASQGYWQFKGATTSDLIDGKYTRTIEIGNIFRGINGYTETDSTTGYDYFMRKATSTVSWLDPNTGVAHQISTAAYIGNWSSYDFISNGDSSANYFNNSGYSNPDGKLNVVTSSIRLLETDGSYAEKGIYISEPFNTTVSSPSYNNLFFEYDFETQ